MDRSAALSDRFSAALEATGMPEVPRAFSVAPHHQLIPGAVLAEIERFIQVFDQVTACAAWQAAVRRESPPISHDRRSEICFFSAWDFHLSPDVGCQLIECNDNGSGALLAAIINAVYYEVAGLAADASIKPPASRAAFDRHIVDMVAQEATAFFDKIPDGLFLILDDAESLREGRFRRELEMLRDLFRRQGWQAVIGCPAQTAWDGKRLCFAGQEVAFVVNRSTDFFWQAEDFVALRQAYQVGHVYVAPNPFTYATRSDKRLLEYLALPLWDAELGIMPAQRRLLDAHVPETHVVRTETLDMLVQRKHEFVFKPLHGFAGRGLLDAAAVGHERLRRLVRQGQGYVAQRWMAKPVMQVLGQSLWTDLRVWAYRGRIFNVSGRASRRLDRLDLAPPGGWLPTFVSV